jgi:hypothetical protein
MHLTAAPIQIHRRHYKFTGTSPSLVLELQQMDQHLIHHHFTSLVTASKLSNCPNGFQVGTYLEKPTVYVGVSKIQIVHKIKYLPTICSHQKASKKSPRIRLPFR